MDSSASPRFLTKPEPGSPSLQHGRRQPARSVSSNIIDTTSPTTTPHNYNTSSDINNLTSLGISVNNDGSITFDASSLDSVLNTDYSGVGARSHRRRRERGRVSVEQQHVEGVRRFQRVHNPSSA